MSELLAEIEQAVERLQINDKNQKRLQLIERSQTADFWNDSQAAQKTMQQIAALETQVLPWLQLLQDARDLKELQAIGDTAMSDELEKQAATISEKFNELRKEMRFNGPYDNHNVVLSIFAGAGGTDAQDWAQMLVRMYARWAENNSFKMEIIEESAGEEAGIKSMSALVRGPFAYGKLRGEHGVHRLVRQSPFNADAKRQTSFAKVDILPEIDEPSEVPLDEADLKIDVFRAGGHGGQSVNTTDSAVRITHLPTGITVSIQNERSQLQNRETALTILRSRLAQLQLEQHASKISELKGPNEQAAWGNQIRSYVLHPYSMVKDLRTRHETSQVQAVLDGDLNQFIEAYLDFSLTE